jgi:hypothetical protein
MYVCMYVVYVCIRVCVYVCVSVCMYVFVYMYLCVCDALRYNTSRGVIMRGDVPNSAQSERVVCLCMSVCVVYMYV